MTAICPTVTAYNPHQYRSQVERLEPFAKRVHIDLMDGVFTPNKSPSLTEVWWPEDLVADLHLMYQQPMDQIDQVLKLKPHLAVIHFEADVNHRQFAERLQECDIKAGLALLQPTTVDEVINLLGDFDHIMVYSGHLGEHGGVADLGLLDKVRQIKQSHPKLEISWDGGINEQNARQLVEAGVSVLNVGGYIHKAEDPSAAYAKLKSVIKG